MDETFALFNSAGKIKLSVSLPCTKRRNFLYSKRQWHCKTPEGDVSVSEGDVIYFPSDASGAHKLMNTSDSEMLIYLDVDTKHRPDVCLYPESNKIGIYGDGIRQIHKTDKCIDYYDGE